MALRVVTAPTSEPISLAEAKLYLRVTDTVDDTLIETLISAARETVEHHSGRSWAAQTLELSLGAFPIGAIELEQGPVTGVTSVSYINAEGVEQTLDESEYSLVGDFVRSLGYWPATAKVPGAVKVRYDAGETVMPIAVHAAILVVLAHLYENREDAGEIPLTARRLLSGVKVY